MVRSKDNPALIHAVELLKADGCAGRLSLLGPRTMNSKLQ
jgi:hypothetical protein